MKQPPAPVQYMQSPRKERLTIKVTVISFLDTNQKNGKKTKTEKDIKRIINIKTKSISTKQKTVESFITVTKDLSCILDGRVS